METRYAFAKKDVTKANERPWKTSDNDSTWGGISEFEPMMHVIHKYILGFFLIFTTISFFGCYPVIREEVERPEEALYRMRIFYPRFQDDMDLDSLAQAIRRNLEYLDKLDPEFVFSYGPHKYTSKQVRESQEAFLKLISEYPDPKELNRKVREQFLIYRAAGRVGNNKVLFTGYFEPVFEGSLTPDDTYKYPLYRQPDDLIKIDLSLFRKELEGETITARIAGKEVLPYYSRRQIEQEKVLKGKHLELAWLKDPVDVTFLQIQGSGRLKLPDGNTITVGYQTSNGLPYQSIGRYMADKGLLSSDELSMQSIRDYLSEHPEALEEVLNQNPSYVFFRILEQGPLGNISVPLTPSRSIALDSRLFPKGALCFISCQRPVVDENGKIISWTNFSRFVLNQDTGGAIRGSGRADIFWGSGPYAELAAGHLKHDGELYVLIKKP